MALPKLIQLYCMPGEAEARWEMTEKRQLKSGLLYIQLLWLDILLLVSYKGYSKSTMEIILE